MQKNRKGRYRFLTIPIFLLYIAASCLLNGKIFRMGILPDKYAGIAVGIQIFLALLFLLLQMRKTTAIFASILALLLTAALGTGTVYLERTWQVMEHITAAQTEEALVSVYVKKDSVAESLKDVVDYKMGIVKELDAENTRKAADSIEEEQGTELALTEFDNMLVMADALAEGNLRSMLLNDAYLDVLGEIPGYEWVKEDLRKLATIKTAVQKTAEASAEGNQQTEKQDQDPQADTDAFLLYISGIDTYGGITARSRSDVNILAAVNPAAKEVFLLSTPRDYYVEYSVTGGAKDKLTHAGIYGVEASMDALERLYGRSIDYYVRMNFTGFMDIIDALGGVDVYSDREFTVPGVKTYTQGYNHVNGKEALAFARERYSFAEGDYHRAEDQMEVIRAVIDKCASSALLSNYDSVMEGIEGSFETSMPQEKIAELIRGQIEDTAKWTVTSYTALGTGKMAETYSMPGQALSVIEPDRSSVEEAKKRIEETFNKTN